VVSSSNKRFHQILLLDEPTGCIDIHAKGQIYTLIRALAFCAPHFLAKSTALASADARRPGQPPRQADVACLLRRACTGRAIGLAAGWDPRNGAAGPRSQQPRHRPGQRDTDSRVDKRVSPLDFNGVRISPGDLVVADRDGAVMVPADIEAEVLELALAKVATEDVVRAHIVGGMTSTDAFASYGVL
jgi:hypothetical protein